MELKLIRKYCKENYTIGNLYVVENGEDLWLCNTIEDKVRDLNKDGDLNDVGECKVMHKTAIPYGKYKILMTVSPKFKHTLWARGYDGIVPLIDEVKHFSGIRIHPGLDEDSTSGCICVGKNTLRGKLTESIDTYHFLMRNYLMRAYKMGEEITIEIV